MPYWQGNGRRIFRRLLSEIVHGAGLPPWVTPYTLRHTCASLLARQGVHPTVAADILGHDPAVYLRTYAHLYPEDRALAAAARGGARPAPVSVNDPAAPFGTARARSARGESAGTLLPGEMSRGRTPAHLLFCGRAGEI